MESLPRLQQPLAALPCLHRPLVAAAAYVRHTCTPEGFIPRAPPPRSLILTASAYGWSHDPSAPPPNPPCVALDAALWRALLLELRAAAPLLPYLPFLDLACRAVFIMAIVMIIVCWDPPFPLLIVAVMVVASVLCIGSYKHHERFNAALPSIAARYTERFQSAGLRLEERRNGDGNDYLIVYPIPPVRGTRRRESPAPPPAVVVAQGLPVVTGMVMADGAALAADAWVGASRDGPADAPIVQGQRIRDVLPATVVVHAPRAERLVQVV
ncbi:hypothetical protein AB1Y20_015576 [Prymnesium parvum]|uniref:Uncharacterized protein n=1 Tax=Prymnesium parvum TaxID=97485 RepID=A0AB34K1V8_PRYPA